MEDSISKLYNTNSLHDIHLTVKHCNVVGPKATTFSVIIIK